MMKKLIIFTSIIYLTLGLTHLSAQGGFDPSYRLVRSQSTVQDKNYYLLTLMESFPAIRKVLTDDPKLNLLGENLWKRIKEKNADCERDAFCRLDAFYFTEKEIETIQRRLEDLVQNNPAIQQMVSNHMRPSGLFYKYQKESDEKMLSLAMVETIKGIHFVIDTYGKGKKGRYPKIDSVSYDVNSFFYQRVMMSVINSIEDDSLKMDLFFQPVMQLSLRLLDMNRRDEAGRHEPMEEGENKKAYQYIAGVDWNKYPYACILQPGHGPENEGVALSPLGKLRVKLVADRFHKGWAPIIILSGGYVHPYQTPFAEATEMKKKLIEEYGIPERAILIEPHARHTTTNFRNAARLMFRYGIPTDKKSICTTTFDQLIYITNPDWKFDARNEKELGYLPYKLLEKVSRNDVEFLPIITSLHADPLDPLDP